jgi:hypothetical protein
MEIQRGSGGKTNLKNEFSYIPKHALFPNGRSAFLIDETIHSDDYVLNFLVYENKSCTCFFILLLGVG